MGGVCDRDQVKRFWKSVVGHEINVVLSLRWKTKSHIGELDKECLIYKEMSNSNSTRPFGKETKSKTMRACLRPKVDNIVLIKQYIVGHGFNKSQYWYQSQV